MEIMLGNEEATRLAAAKELADTAAASEFAETAAARELADTAAAIATAEWFKELALIDTGGGGGRHMGSGDGSPERDKFNPEAEGSVSEDAVLLLELRAEWAEWRSLKAWCRCAACEAIWNPVKPALSLRKSKGCMFWSLFKGDMPGLPVPMPGNDAPLIVPLEGESFMKFREFL